VNDALAEIRDFVSRSIVVEFATIRKSRGRRWLDGNMQDVWCFINIRNFDQFFGVRSTDKAADVRRNRPRPFQRAHEFWRIAAGASLRSHITPRLHLTPAGIATEDPQNSRIVT
jgi:hypothetical protein